MLLRYYGLLDQLPLHGVHGWLHRAGGIRSVVPRSVRTEERDDREYYGPLLRVVAASYRVR